MGKYFVKIGDGSCSEVSFEQYADDCLRAHVRRIEVLEDRLRAQGQMISALEKRVAVLEWTPIASSLVMEFFRLKRIIHKAYDQLIVDGPNTAVVAAILKDGL